MTHLPNVPFQWWLERLPRYNLGLALAGILAFIAHVIVGELFFSDDAGSEITLLTILVQGIGYLVMMVIANVCYMIGPVSEGILRPDDVRQYRERWYNLGCRFSFALPFCVPVLLLSMSVLRFIL